MKQIRRRIHNVMQMVRDTLSRMFFGLPLVSDIQDYPQIGLGGAFRKHGAAYLKKLGYTAVISLRTTVPFQGLPTLHLPTRDWTGITLEDLRKGVTFIDGELAKGGKVYIHCRQGVGRGPSMAAAYLISKGLTVEEAISRLKNARGFIRPTRKQVEQLRIYSKELQEMT